MRSLVRKWIGKSEAVLRVLSGRTLGSNMCCSCFVLKVAFQENWVDIGSNILRSCLKIMEPREHEINLPTTVWSSPRIQNPSLKQAEAKRLASKKLLEAERVQHQLNIVHEQDARTLPIIEKGCVLWFKKQRHAAHAFLHRCGHRMLFGNYFFEDVARKEKYGSRKTECRWEVKIGQGSKND